MLLRYSTEVALAFVVVWCIRQIVYRRRFAGFRKLPSPPSTSWLWGHEWLLYSTPPGALYREWRETLGQIYQVDGCFGVRVLPRCSHCMHPGAGPHHARPLAPHARRLRPSSRNPRSFSPAFGQMAQT
jgi:hypothetical protein